MSFAVLALLGAVPLGAFSGAARAESVGTLAFVQGVVLVDGVAGKSGTAVGRGSVVETRGDGKCAVLFKPDTVVHLADKAKLVVSEYLMAGGQRTTAKLDLQRGQARALVRPSALSAQRPFRIHTRSATMGVRGTEVLVSVPANPSQPARFVTVEGRAEVSLPGSAAPPISLGANQSLSVAAPPPPSAAAGTSGPGSSSAATGAASGGATGGPTAGAAPSAEAPRPTTLDPGETQKLADAVAPAPPALSGPGDTKRMAAGGLLAVNAPGAGSGPPSGEGEAGSENGPPRPPPPRPNPPPIDPILDGGIISPVRAAFTVSKVTP